MEEKIYTNQYGERYKFDSKNNRWLLQQRGFFGNTWTPLQATRTISVNGRDIKIGGINSGLWTPNQNIQTSNPPTAKVQNSTNRNSQRVNNYVPSQRGALIHSLEANSPIRWGNDVRQQALILGKTANQKALDMLNAQVTPNTVVNNSSKPVIKSKPIYGFNGDVQTFRNTLNNLGITDRNGVIKMQRQLRNAGYNIDDDGRWGNNTQSAYEDFITKHIMKQAAYKPDDTIEESLPESILTKHTTPNFNWRNVTAPLAEKNISRLLPLTTSQSTDINYAKNGAKLISKNQIQRFKEGGYTVKKGDTFSGIAKSHGMSLNQLLSLNKDIRNPDKINIGQKIRISSSDDATKHSSKTSTPPSLHLDALLKDS